MAAGFPLSLLPPTRPRTHQLPQGLQPVNTDRWYYRVFQSAPDLIRSLLPGSTATAAPSATPPPPRSRPYQWISWKPWP